MRKEISKLTAVQAAELAALAAQPEAEIDLEALPEQRDWSGAQRGLFHGPADAVLSSVKASKRR